MKVLIIGKGGREHAIAWNCVKHGSEVFVAPGNAGTHLEESITNIDIEVTNIDGLLTFAKSNQIDLTIVGPEAPLVLGMVDRFIAEGLNIFGPTEKASELEGSKKFCKDFLKRNNIPTPEYETFTQKEKAIEYIKQKGAPLVIKADGLAKGKGVVIAKDIQTAAQTAEDFLENDRFGEAGHQIVIEEFLTGQEVSFIVMTDGDFILPLATSQDHKARDDGDKGPNTGGMGAYSPTPIVTDELKKRIMEQIIKPTTQAMKKEGRKYTGFLYAGLMIDKEGNAKVLEYNCRLGDPETQPILMRLKSNIADACFLSTQGKLNEAEMEWDKRVALGVVMASNGYPGKYQTGDKILLPDETLDTKIFHAGTKYENNQVLSDGGRVLCVTALGDDIKDAQIKAYSLVKQASWNNAYYRNDIGFRV